MREVPVRVNEADSAAGFDVLEDEIAKERCFPGPALADGIEMMTPIRLGKAKRGFLPPFFAQSQNNVLVTVHFQSSPYSAESTSEHPRRRLWPTSASLPANACNEPPR